jgi:type IV secretory pathway TraG/TraD family ATPase VirD4
LVVVRLRRLLFDPTNAKSSAYNPLLEVRRGEWEARDVQNIADILVDPEGTLEKRNHWEKTSHALLVGAILHVLYAEEDKTLASVASFLSDPKRPIESTLSAMMRTPHLGEAGVQPRRRFRRTRASEQIRQRTVRRAQHGHVVPRPLPRSRLRRGDAPLRLADR